MFPLIFDAIHHIQPPQNRLGGFSPRLPIFSLPGWNNISVFVPRQSDGVHHSDHRQQIQPFELLVWGSGRTAHVESCLPRRSRSGRWRSEYEVNIGSRSLQGKIAVDVHYYEQGNVSYITPLDLFLPLTRQICLRSS